MILKSYLIEKNLDLLIKYNSALIYGENIGLKDDIKNNLKKYLEDYEQINFNQEELLRDKNIFFEQIENISLFNKKKVIFINEITDKMKNLYEEAIEKSNSDLKIYLFAQTLEKKSFIRKIFEKEKRVAVVACYKDNERTLSEYTRKKLEGYSGMSQETINFIINNSGLDRKILSNEIDKIKTLFIDKKILNEKLPELLNNNNNLDFNDIRDSCLSAEKLKLNRDLGNVVFQNENAYFYISILNNRIETLFNICTKLKEGENIENVIDDMKPPIFWKDKPIYFKQVKKWNTKKLNEAKEMLLKTEIYIKKGSGLNNNTLIKNLIMSLYERAATIS